MRTRAVLGSAAACRRPPAAWRLLLRVGAPMAGALPLPALPLAACQPLNADEAHLHDALLAVDLALTAGEAMFDAPGKAGWGGGLCSRSVAGLGGAGVCACACRG